MAQAHQIERMSSRAGGDERPRGWRLTLRGVVGSIKARGTFPCRPEAFKTADIKFYDGAWWFSVCVEIADRLKAGAEKLRVELDLIDEFASVKLANGRCAPGLSNPFSNGREGEINCISKDLPEAPCGGPRNAGSAQGTKPGAPERPSCGGSRNAGNAGAADKSDAIQSARDRKYKRGSIRWRREKLRIARLRARQARRTKEALHRWTTAIVEMSAEITVIAPPVKDVTRTGRGNSQFHGAQVETIAALNRRILGMAPASAVQMLEYKAAEAGVACVVERRSDHQTRVGGDLKHAAIATRRAKRVVKRAAKLEAAE